MAGLRERQKNMRRESICAAAAELFRVRGYDATTVEAIAEAAGVSAPTVFNYFGSKQDIALALLEGADSPALEEAKAAVREACDVIDALMIIDGILTDHEYKVLPPQVWNELLPKWIRSPPPQLTAMNDRIIVVIEDTLLSLKAKGLIKEGVDIPFIARFLNSYTSLRSSQGYSKEQHRMHMRSLITHLVNGIG